ncbi:MAG: LysO family transporter [Bacteroidales bacterium]|nr:LysO family transporter [Bacteroidales bacterium]
MWIILGLMTAGMVIGAILRHNEKIIKRVNILVTWSIFALLFLLGIAVGLNDELVKNLDSLGIHALVITIASILGSVILSWIVYHYFFRNHK